ncbi:hypothetical protein BZA05DRAFT_400836 [Tricharina praecox]|uniref:uncharacterized protein n=1 Tax=Tricharina praecox TaxID=43433 RepID=UPI00221F6C24|nr:uncharacterized protein BZA05DRAFT_400836 [Tricharina praecox]KAI5850073.1 hypothetical protein BZA05DRAFT_400836 [Tricharina praecox]
MSTSTSTPTPTSTSTSTPTPPPPPPHPTPSQPGADPASSSAPTEYARGRERFQSKQRSEYFDPCQAAAERSLKCLHRNKGDKEFCSDYFQAYRDCKKRWTEERKEEKRKASAWW